MYFNKNLIKTYTKINLKYIVNITVQFSQTEVYPSKF